MINVPAFILVESKDLLAEIYNMKHPMSAAYKLSMVIDEVNIAIKDFEQKRNEVVLRNVKKDSGGNPVPFIDDKNVVQPNTFQVIDPETFNKEQNELFNQTYNLNCDFLMLDEYDHIHIEAEKVKKLRWLFISN